MIFDISCLNSPTALSNYRADCTTSGRCSFWRASSCCASGAVQVSVCDSFTLHQFAFKTSPASKDSHSCEIQIVGAFARKMTLVFAHVLGGRNHLFCVCAGGVLHYIVLKSGDTYTLDSLGSGRGFLLTVNGEVYWLEHAVLCLEDTVVLVLDFKLPATQLQEYEQQNVSLAQRSQAAGEPDVEAL